MIARLLVIGGGIVAGVAAAAAVWARRRAELEAAARRAEADAIEADAGTARRPAGSALDAMPDALEASAATELGLRPLPAIGTSAEPSDPLPSRSPAVATGARPADGPGSDDLREIKGIGAVSEGRLHDAGVTRIAQIAAWTDEDVERIAERISISPERIRRDDWVGQARSMERAGD